MPSVAHSGRCTVSNDGSNSRKRSVMCTELYISLSWKMYWAVQYITAPLPSPTLGPTRRFWSQSTSSEQIVRFSLHTSSVSATLKRNILRVYCTEILDFDDCLSWPGRVLIFLDYSMIADNWNPNKAKALLQTQKIRNEECKENGKDQKEKDIQKKHTGNPQEFQPELKKGVFENRTKDTTNEYGRTHTA